MDKVNGKLTVYFEEPFWVAYLSVLKMVNYLWRRQHLVQNQKITKYRNIFKNTISV